MTFEEARAAFPALEDLVHLNAGTFGPLARTTVEAMSAEAERELALGRGGEPYYERRRALRAVAREALAAVLGVDASRVALTYSTSAACNLVLAGLDLTPDDEIVTTDSEHFGLIGPLRASGARIRVARIRHLPPARAHETILAEVGPRTRLLALSHVSWITGNVLPVGELKKETGLPLLVDGAQTAGAVAVDASPFDFYAVSGQKWLCGPDATGALYVADPEGLRVALPTHLSQERYEPDGSFAPKAGAARFDSGAVPLPSLAGLVTAIETAPEWRFEGAREVAGLCRRMLAERYEVITAPDQATLVTFRPGGDAAGTAARLYERGVLVRDIPRTDWLRASCGYWTSEQDVQLMLDVLEGPTEGQTSV